MTGIMKRVKCDRKRAFRSMAVSICGPLVSVSNRYPGMKGMPPMLLTKTVMFRWDTLATSFSIPSYGSFKASKTRISNLRFGNCFCRADRRLSSLPLVLDRMITLNPWAAIASTNPSPIYVEGDVSMQYFVMKTPAQRSITASSRRSRLRGIGKCATRSRLYGLCRQQRLTPSVPPVTKAYGSFPCFQRFREDPPGEKYSRVRDRILETADTAVKAPKTCSAFCTYW